MLSKGLAKHCLKKPPARDTRTYTMLRDALGRHASVARAASELGITRQGLSKLMARLQVDRFDPGREPSVQTPFR